MTTSRSRPLRVLHVVPFASSKSAMVFAHRQIEGLRAIGIENDVFSLKTRTSIIGLLRDVKSLRELARSGKYDIVHAQYGTMTAFVAAVTQPTPTVVTYCGSDLNPCPTIPQARWLLGHLLSQLAAVRARGIVCVSRQLRNRLWWRKAIATVIPNGIDLTTFRPGDRAMARERIGVRPDAAIVVFNEGAAPAGKGGQLVRESMEMVRRDMPAAELIVLDGDIAPDKVADYLVAADCLAFASDWEGSPNIVKEALAVNIPVVSVDVGDVRELFGTLDAVSVVARTTEAMAGGLLAALGRRARVSTAPIVEGRLDAVSTARRIAQVYENVLGEHRRIESMPPIQGSLHRRVLQVVPAVSEPNGMIFAYRQITALEKIGLTCDVFRLRTRTSLFGLVQELVRLRRLVRSGQYDLVHAQYGTVTGCLTTWCQPLPTVVTFRGSDLNPNQSMSHSRWLVGQLLSQLAAVRAAAIICVSRQLRERLWCRRDIVHIVPSGVDCELFVPGDQAAARTRLGWTADSLTVLFNEGTAPVGKGGPFVREVMEIVRKSVPEAQLVALDGRVTPERVADHLNAADCLVLASKWEGSPNIVKEALAVNLPVVSLDVGDVEELFSAVDGVTICSGDPDAFARGVTEVLRRGRRPATAPLIASQYSAAASAKRILNVYQTAWN